MSNKHECARSGCKLTLQKECYRIWNNPISFPPYRQYCLLCGRRIVESNPTIPYRTCDPNDPVDNRIPLTPKIEAIRKWLEDNAWLHMKELPDYHAANAKFENTPSLAELVYALFEE